jgi:AraC family transcriptional regulator of adaptative response / DNA-3-methyladenine glycosylase II
MDLDHAACYRALAARDPRFDGRFLVGVTSTGIYCRPICPARTPRPENARFFASAAAAQQAGFRPCLRCRPETSPDLAVWHGTANTVTRALALIERGALDDAGIEALAERLGLGGRQLRRLFQRHLGASPIAVAQTRRVLLAKQLIHDTPLPMGEVALAAGFGSVRRFNETFQRLFARPPAALRRRRRGSDAAEAVSLTLAYRPPYDWEAILAYLAARAMPGVEAVASGRYHRSIALGEGRGVVSVAPAARDRLSITLRFPDLTALPTIIARLRRVFDLAADPAAIAQHLRSDPALARLVEARPGLRVPGAWDGFELAVRAILGQQITVTAATKLAGKLVRAFGEALPPGLTADPGLTHVFPTPARLAAADIAALGMPAARARSLGALAAAVAADPRLFGPRQSLEAAVERLRALPGIGEWTAQYIAMRELREPDAFPAADIGLARAMADGEGTRPTPAALLARAERWRPWRAYAAVHLWSSQHRATAPHEVIDAAITNPPLPPRSRADADRRSAPGH